LAAICRYITLEVGDPILEMDDDREDFGEPPIQVSGQVADDVLFVVYTCASRSRAVAQDSLRCAGKNARHHHGGPEPRI
jgi:hypothetical protein